MTLKPKSSGLVRPICVYHVKGAVITGCCRQLGLEYRVDGGRTSRHPGPRHSLMSPVKGSSAGTMRTRSFICHHAQPRGCGRALELCTAWCHPPGRVRGVPQQTDHAGWASPRERVPAPARSSSTDLPMQGFSCGSPAQHLHAGTVKHTPHVCFKPLDLAGVEMWHSGARV